MANGTYREIAKWVGIGLASAIVGGGAGISAKDTVDRNAVKDMIDRAPSIVALQTEMVIVKEVVKEDARENKVDHKEILTLLREIRNNGN